MKARILPLCVVVVLALALGAVTTACDDGGGELTLAEYFEKLEQLDAERDERNAELDEQYDEDSAAAESDEDEIEATRAAFSGGLSSTKELLDGIGDLDPPAEAEDAHGAVVEAGEEALSAMEEVVDQLREAESLADVAAAFSGDLEDAMQALEQSCLDLQAIADDNDIDADLGCGD